MRRVQQAVHAAIVDEPAITSLLGVFELKPAVFTQSPIPGVATGPYIVIGDSVADTAFDTKTSVGRTTLTDIAIYDVESGNPTAVQDVAELVRDLFHRSPVTVEGYGAFLADATGPIEAPTADQIYGRIVSVTLTSIRRS